MSPAGRIEIVPFAPDRLVALIRLAERAWPDRPRSDDFYRWRYLHAPAQRILLAVRGEECLATLAAFQRDYLLEGKRRACLETLDWYCLPEYRFSGLGVRVLQALMKSAEPIVAVGGTRDTLAVLPRLGWSRMAMLTHYLLPLRGEGVEQGLRRRIRLPAEMTRLAFGILGRVWFAPRIRSRPPDGEARSVDSVDEEILPLYAGETGYRVLPLPSLAHLRWVTREYPEGGRFLALYFLVRGALKGWSLLRVYGSGSRRWGSLIDLYAPRPDEALYSWMVSETLVRAAAFQPVGIDAQSACPILRQALRRNRFLELGTSPVHLHPPGASVSDPVHMLRNASDGPLFPYPGSATPGAGS